MVCNFQGRELSCRNYHGHIVEHLKIVRDGLAAQSKRSFVYLMGDSSLDNKCGAACVLLRANMTLNVSAGIGYCSNQW
jgi:hypothetical protein